MLRGPNVRFRWKADVWYASFRHANSHCAQADRCEEKEAWMPKGSLSLAAVAIIVGGGGFLEQGGEFSFRSFSLGLGLGILLLWLERRLTRDTKTVRDRSEAALR